MSFYDLVEVNADGKPISFKQFEGKVVYGVNVASECGLTACGYDLLARISKMEGTEVLLFPCNQFGAQEPGTDAEIKAFCEAKGVQNAHVFTKADVNGDNTRATYRVLRSAGLGEVPWNFEGRFVVDKQGNILLPESDEKVVELVTSLL